MACRNEEKAAAAAATITAKAPKGSVEVRRLDLADLGSVAAFADSLLADEGSLDLLANNAGLMALDQGRTADGFEMQFGVNHLGHFALTARLLPLLTSTPSSRVVTMASFGHRPGRLHVDDPNFERRKYNRWTAYFQSKLANVLFSSELQRRLAASGAPTISVAAHPGYSHTELGVGDGGFANSVNALAARYVAMSPERGALPFLRAATDPGVTGGTFWGPHLLSYGRPVSETPEQAGPQRRRRPRPVGRSPRSSPTCTPSADPPGPVRPTGRDRPGGSRWRCPRGRCTNVWRSGPTSLASSTSRPLLPQLGDGGVDVVDQDGEVLTHRRGHVELDEVDLGGAQVDPGAGDAEVGTVVADGPPSTSV